MSVIFLSFKCDVVRSQGFGKNFLSITQYFNSKNYVVLSELFGPLLVYRKKIGMTYTYTSVRIRGK